MSADLDLFQAAEPRTCGNCGACEWDKRKREDFCALSYKTVLKTDKACDPSWWYPRAKDPA